MRVLVTGAFGFIGTAVVAQLAAAGHDVVALTHKPPGTLLPASRARAVIHGDIRDAGAIRAAVRDVDAVCHLAALSVVRDSFARPAEYHQVNALGTRSVVAALAARMTECGNSALFVHASTHAVYGPSAQPIAETAPVAPMSPYGHSKVAAEDAIAAAARAGALSAVCLRLANVAGAVDGKTDTELNRLIPRALAVAAGRAPVLGINGNGSTIRDYVHVADAADAFLLALEACHRRNFALYNVGATAASTMDIITAAEQITGRAIPVIHNPPTDESPMMVADITRIGRELSWVPRRSSLNAIIGDAWDVIKRRLQKFQVTRRHDIFLSEMRMPDFLLIGAPKAGTTALHVALDQHPELYMSAVKEPQFFLLDGMWPDACGDLGEAPAYQEHARRRADYEALFDSAGPGALCAESTPLYLYNRDAVRRIRSTIPDSRLIAIVRDPVERAYSNWAYLRSAGREPVDDFIRACDEEDSRIASGWASHYHYVGLGLYGTQFEHLFTHFPRDQVLVLDYQQLVDEPILALDRICEFLHVGRGILSEIPQENVTAHGNRPRHSPDPQQRLELLPRFEDDIRLLGSILGEDFTGWLLP